MSKALLIIAQDPTLIYLLRRYAEESGFESVKVCQGRDALIEATKAQPSAFVLDSNLSEISSLDLLKQIKTSAKLKHIPVLMCGWEGHISDAFNDDIAGYFNKSILFSDFVSLLNDTGINPDEVDIQETRSGSDAQEVKTTWNE